MAARSAAEAAPIVVAGSGTRSETEGAAACATSPGSEITTGPRSATAVVIAVLTMGRSCSGLTSRPMYSADASISHKPSATFLATCLAPDHQAANRRPRFALRGYRDR
jgi:hypothetical protein